MISFIKRRQAGYLGSILTLCLVLNWFAASACCDGDSYTFCFEPEYAIDCIGCLPNQNGAVLEANVVVRFRSEEREFNYLPTQVCFTGRRQGGEELSINVLQICQGEEGLIVLSCNGRQATPEACDQPNGGIKRVKVPLKCRCFRG